MSSIDAAIIRTLVEHIGGNPDSIPDGAIGGVQLTKQPGRIERVNAAETNSYDYNIANDELRSGDILRLKFVDGGKTFYRDYMYLIVKDGGNTGQFISLDDMFYILTFTRTNGKYRTNDGSADSAADDFENDDNVGIYRVSDPTLAGFFKMFSILMSMTHADSF